MSAIPLLSTFRSVDVIGHGKEIQFPEIGRSFVCRKGPIWNRKTLITIRQKELSESVRISRLGLEVRRQHSVSVHNAEVAVLPVEGDGRGPDLADEGREYEKGRKRVN